jgi:hypothetical protein
MFLACLAAAVPAAALKAETKPGSAGRGTCPPTEWVDVVVFHYPEGDKEAEARAVRNMRRIRGKWSACIPMPAGGDWPAVTIQRREVLIRG